jgi:hypothetical protein
MPTETKGMKLAITSSEEILSLLKLLNELEGLYKYDLVNKYLSNCDLSEFEIIKDFNQDNPEEFLEEVLKAISNIHFQRILWNADTMLRNCADLEKYTLDFSPEIKRGLELVELEKIGKLKISE